MVVEHREALAPDLVRGGVVQQHAVLDPLHGRREVLERLVAVLRRALVRLLDVGSIGDLVEALGRHRRGQFVEPIGTRRDRQRSHDAQRGLVAEDRLLDILEARGVDHVRPLGHLDEALGRVVVPMLLRVAQDHRRARGRVLVPEPVLAGLVHLAQFRFQERRRVMVEPVLGARMEVEVDDGEALARLEVLPVLALVVIHAAERDTTLSTAAQDPRKHGSCNHPVKVAVVVNRQVPGGGHGI